MKVICSVLVIWSLQWRELRTLEGYEVDSRGDSLMVQFDEHALPPPTTRWVAANDCRYTADPVADYERFLKQKEAEKEFEKKQQKYWQDQMREFLRNHKPCEAGKTDCGWGI